MDRRKVLDQGYVQLVDHMGGDLSIVRSARVSYAAAWRAGADEGSDTRLIRYLWNNAHTSPFESVVMTFEVKAPIFVLRQWHRHRTWSYNEISARYTELPEEYYVPAKEDITQQAVGNKQMRDDIEHESSEHLFEEISAAQAASYANYKHLLDCQCPRELARIITPVGMYSHMFATVNLLNLFRFLKSRLHPHAQKEIRVYAEALLEIAREVAPVATEAFENEMRIDAALSDIRARLLKR